MRAPITWQWHLVWYIAILCLGIALGYRIRQGDEPKPVMQKPAPEIVQRDGSVIPEVRPDPDPPKPAHIIPAGYVETRRITAQIKPKKADCPPVNLDLSLIEKNGSQRAVLSADGTITQSLDIPIKPFLALPTHKWAVGVSYDPFGKSYGGWIDRDISRIRVGAEVVQAQKGGVEARVRLGIKF